MTHKPQQLQAVAILQLVSGALNLFLIWYFASSAWALLGTSASCVVGMILGLLGSAVGCPLGFLFAYCGLGCGAIGLALIPVGFLELVAGIAGLVQPRGAGTLGRVAAWAEIGSLLAGGLISCVVGVVVLVLYRAPEVRAFEDDAQAGLLTSS